jgi:hypothetical protein
MFTFHPKAPSVVAIALATAAIGAGHAAASGAVRIDGHYDPARSVYVQTPSSAVVPSTRPARIVKNSTGGYYDPSRSVFVVSAAAQPSVPFVSRSSFSWPDASVGAGAALGIVLLLAGGTLAVGRRRSIAAG